MWQEIQIWSIPSVIHQIESRIFRRERGDQLDRWLWRPSYRDCRPLVRRSNREVGRCWGPPSLCESFYLKRTPTLSTPMNTLPLSLPLRCCCSFSHPLTHFTSINGPVFLLHLFPIGIYKWVNCCRTSLIKLNYRQVFYFWGGFRKYHLKIFINNF